MSRFFSGIFVTILMLVPVFAFSAGDPDADSAAVTVALKKGHPQVYLVQRGDTLWGISNRFLDSPWLWKDIWYANPEIKNPHLIYPGDRIALVLVDGKTRLQVSRRGRAVVKLSPKVREVSDRETIAFFGKDKLLEFSALPRIMSKQEFDAGAYILKTAGERLVAGSNDKVLVRGLVPQQGRDHGVYRLGQEYKNPTSGETLGFEVLNIADGYIQRWGDPATMYIKAASQEILKGMRVFPPDPQDSFIHFSPTKPKQQVKGEVIGFLDGLTTGAQDSVVTINLGSKDDVARGQIFGVFEGGETLVDDEREPEGFFGKGWFTSDEPKTDMEKLPAEVILPERRFGLIVVFRVYESVSYGVIMTSSQAVRVGHKVHAP